MKGVASSLTAAMLATGFAGAASTVPRWGAPVLAGELPTHATPTELKTVDMNGDGLRDVVVVQLLWPTHDTFPVSILLNKGRGRFVDVTATTFKGPGIRTEWARKIVAADFNGDGRTDLFIADTGLDKVPRVGGQNKLALSTPDGKLVDATLDLPQEKSFTHEACAADVDGDGSTDVFVGNVPASDLPMPRPHLLLNDGKGHFATTTPQLNGVPLDAYGNYFYTSCEFADVNGDKSPDLLLGAGENIPQSAVALNDGSGHFRALPGALPDEAYGRGKGIVLDYAPVDVNGDGAVDLLSAESQVSPYYIGSRLQVLIGDGHGMFRDETAARLTEQPTGKSWPNRLLVEDMNDDGAPDLSIQYAPPGIAPGADNPPYWLNDGHGVFHAIAGPGSPAPPHLRGPVGFVNGDGPHAVFFLEGDTSGAQTQYWVAKQLTLPPPPTGLRTSAAKNGITITWSAVAGATRYEVWRSSSLGGRGRRVATALTNRYVDRTARPRVTYYFSVRSGNGDGESAFTPAVSARRP